MFNRKIVFSLVVALIILYLLNFRLTNNRKQPSSADWTVYGTMGCGWTRKQLKHMKDNKISHKFIDCGDVNAFPTLKDANGKMIEGFTLVQ